VQCTVIRPTLRVQLFTCFLDQVAMPFAIFSKYFNICAHAAAEAPCGIMDNDFFYLRGRELNLGPGFHKKQGKDDEAGNNF